jgi:hypothetical protein
MDKLGKIRVNELTYTGGRYFRPGEEYDYYQKANKKIRYCGKYKKPIKIVVYLVRIQGNEYYLRQDKVKEL